MASALTWPSAAAVGHRDGKLGAGDRESAQRLPVLPRVGEAGRGRFLARGDRAELRAAVVNVVGDVGREAGGGDPRGVDLVGARGDGHGPLGGACTAAGRAGAGVAAAVEALGAGGPGPVVEKFAAAGRIVGISARDRRSSTVGTARQLNGVDADRPVGLDCSRSRYGRYCR